MEKLADLFLFQNDGESLVKKVKLVSSAVLLLSCFELANYLFEERGYAISEASAQAFLSKHYISAFLILYSAILGVILLGDLILFQICSMMMTTLRHLFRMPKGHGWSKGNDIVERQAQLANVNLLVKAFSRLSVTVIALYAIYLTIIKNRFPDLYSYILDLVLFFTVMSLWGARFYGADYVYSLEEEISSLQKKQS